MNQRNIRILYAVSCLQGMIFYGPIATLYRAAAGVTVFQITLIESVSLALCVLLEVPWGVAADRIGYRKTMIFCCGLYFVSKIVFWRAEGFWAFLTERVLLSVVISGISGVDTSILYLSCEKGKSQGVFGIYNNLNTAGLIFAAAVYTLFIKENYRLSGLLTVASYGLAAALAFGLTEVRGSEPRHASPFRSFAEVLRKLVREPALLMLLVAVALLNESHQTITVFLNQLQYVRCGMNDATIGAVYAGVTVAGLAGGLSARVTGRLGERRTGLLLFACGAIACVTLAVTRSALLSVLAILLLRVAFSLLQPLQTDLQNRWIDSPDRATALSVNAMLVDGVAILTNLAFGRLAEWNLSCAMLLGATFCLAALALYARACRIRRNA